MFRVVIAALQPVQWHWGALGPTILNKILGIPCFSGTEREKDTAQFEQWYHAISDAWKNFNEQLVRAAITKSCVGDAADAMCCLLPGRYSEKVQMAIWVCRIFWYFDAGVLQNHTGEEWESSDLCSLLRKGPWSHKTAASLHHDWRRGPQAFEKLSIPQPEAKSL